MSAQIDALLHAPTRLQIAAILAQVSEAEFARLREVTQVSDSVLSKHLAALVEARYVRLRKASRAGRQRTWAILTIEGRSALRGHLTALRALVASAEQALAAE